MDQVLSVLKILLLAHNCTVTPVLQMPIPNTYTQIVTCPVFYRGAPASPLTDNMSADENGGDDYGSAPDDQEQPQHHHERGDSGESAPSPDYKGTDEFGNGGDNPTMKHPTDLPPPDSQGYKRSELVLPLGLVFA